jgi:hypothetical protein
MTNAPHSPYSPDVTPSDCYLFAYEKHCLAGISFANQMNSIELERRPLVAEQCWECIVSVDDQCSIVALRFAGDTALSDSEAMPVKLFHTDVLAGSTPMLLYLSMRAASRSPSLRLALYMNKSRMASSGWAHPRSTKTWRL